jgi:hypothetical protein
LFAASRNTNDTVAGCTASLNVTEGAADTDTPVAPFAGVNPDTDGGVTSAVVNDHVD